MFTKMFKKIKKRTDRGDSNLISILFLLPLILMILMTMIDTAVYFSDRAVIQNTARDGARTVAIMGGNGTATTGTPIEKKYGLSRSIACNGNGTKDYPGVPSDSIAYPAKNSNSTAIECNIMQGINASQGLISVTVNSVKCTPNIVTTLGGRVSCEVIWSYNSIPGSGLSALRDPKTGDATFKSNVTAGSSESEVRYDGPENLVPRS